MNAAQRLAVWWVLTFPLTTALEAQSASPVDVGGYVRALGAYQDLGYQLPNRARRSAFGDQVLRLKWRLERGGVRLSVHNRVRATVTSTTTAARVIGVGVSTPPGRSVDLHTTLIDDAHVRASHDIDRLALTVLTAPADITVGRQAVTWGTSNLFPVVDLWAQFSPFELDTEEKPGTDAIRVLMYPTDDVEIDVVVGDRGTRRDLSVGVRTTIETSAADVYVAAGKFWRRFVAAVGVSTVFDTWRVRGEAAFPWELDGGARGRARATIGVDWFRSDVQLSAEYHHNGLGAGDSNGYGDVLTSPAFGRGETYYLGRHLLGGLAAYQPTDVVQVFVSALVNPTDPSVAVIPAVSFDAVENTQLTLGALVSRGATPVIGGPQPVPTVTSEFGTYGSVAYARASLHF